MPQFATPYESNHYLQSHRILALAAAIQALTPAVNAEAELASNYRQMPDGVATLALKDALRQMKQQLLFD